MCKSLEGNIAHLVGKLARCRASCKKCGGCSGLERSGVPSRMWSGELSADSLVPLSLCPL
jgi:hypothetical protein